jgi:hypothetical protein
VLEYLLSLAVALAFALASCALADAAGHYTHRLK